MRRIITGLLGLILLAAASTGSAAEPKPYKEGPVIAVSYIKVKNGRFDDYMAFLDTSYKSLMEAYKKAGLITGYGVYSATARTPHEADLILTISYVNMAALDKTDDFDGVAEKVMGSNATQNKASIDRDAMREVLGGELIREPVFK